MCVLEVTKQQLCSLYAFLSVLYYWRDTVLIVVQYSICMEKPQSVSQCKLPTKQLHDLKWPAFGLTSSG